MNNPNVAEMEPTSKGNEDKRLRITGSCLEPTFSLISPVLSKMADTSQRSSHQPGSMACELRDG